MIESTLEIKEKSHFVEVKVLLLAGSSETRMQCIRVEDIRMIWRKKGYPDQTEIEMRDRLVFTIDCSYTNFVLGLRKSGYHLVTLMNEERKE